MGLLKYKRIDKFSINFLAVRTDSEPVVATLRYINKGMYVLVLPNIRSVSFHADSWYAAKGIAYTILNLIENHGLKYGL